FGLVRSLIRRNSDFPRDLSGRLILSESLEGCLSNQVIARPRGECNLSDQLRLYPDCIAARFSRNLSERALLLHERIEPSSKHSMRLLRIPSSGASGVPQFSVAIVP